MFEVAGKKRHQLADYLKSHLSRSLNRTVRRTCLKGVIFLLIDLSSHSWRSFFAVLIADCPTYRGYFTSHEILDENPVVVKQSSSIGISTAIATSLSVFFPLDLPRNFWQISRDIMTDLMSLCGALSQTELAPGDQNLPKFGLVLYKVGPAYNGKKWRFFIYFLTNYQWPRNQWVHPGNLT